VLAKIHSRLTYANVMATFAVFIALGGSSYAALRVTGRNVPKNALTGADIRNLTGKDVRNNSLTGADVKKLTSADVTNGRLLAKDFAAGQLPRGERGEKGDQGERGAQGPTGSPGASFDTGLPSGKTLRGVYEVGDFAANANEFTGESVTYAAALPANPAVHEIPSGSTPPAECPGTVADPQAAPGHLCVYESINFTTNREPVNAFINPTNTAEGKFGFHLFIGAVNAGSYSSLGTWAVTAP
jgi:hypothetical protein